MPIPESKLSIINWAGLWVEVVVRVYLEVDPTDPTDLAGLSLLVGSVGSVSLNPNYLVVREVVRGLVQV